MTEEIEKKLHGIEHQLKFFRDAYITLHNSIIDGAHHNIGAIQVKNSFTEIYECLGQLKEVSKDFKEISKELRNESIIGTMQFMAKQIHEMQKSISQIKEKGLKKEIQLDFTLDGYEMVRKNASILDDIPEQEIKKTEDNSLALLSTLSERETAVLVHRFGLFENKEKTLAAVGKILGVSGQQIRNIGVKALRKCRHPTRRNLVENLTHKELKKAILGE